MQLYSQALYAIKPLPNLETENVETEHALSVTFVKEVTVLFVDLLF